MFPVTISSGKVFNAKAGEPVLDAALRHGVVLGYSCRTGRCSSCRGRLVSGDSRALHAELGLTQTEQQQGFILTCVREACGPLTLEMQDLGDVVLPAPRTQPCRIQSLEKLAPDVLHITLRLPPTSAFDFLPGQYVDVIGSGGLRRSYSIANAPRADKLIELHIREVPGGAMSRYWFNEAKVNDLLRLHGPSGTFFLRGQQGKHLVLLATGTGIAPVKAIAEGLAMTETDLHPLSVTVYWGGRQAPDLYWRPESLAVRHRFVPVLSRADASWSGARGHVQDVMLGERQDLPNSLVYACGSEAMIHSAQATLLAAGLPKSQFHADAFVCSAASS